MATVYRFERGPKALFAPGALDGRYDQVFAIRGDLEGCVHRDVQEVQHRLVDYQSRAVSMLGQPFNHGERLHWISTFDIQCIIYAGLVKGDVADLSILREA